MESIALLIAVFLIIPSVCGMRQIIADESMTFWQSEWPADPGKDVALPFKNAGTDQTVNRPAKATNALSLWYRLSEAWRKIHAQRAEDLCWLETLLAGLIALAGSLFMFPFGM